MAMLESHNPEVLAAAMAWVIAYFAEHPVAEEPPDNPSPSGEESQP
jgi:hypothetical protein